MGPGLGAGPVGASQTDVAPPGSDPSGPGTSAARISDRKSPVATVLKSPDCGTGCSTMPTFRLVNALMTPGCRVRVGPYSCTKQQKKFGLPGWFGLFWK